MGNEALGIIFTYTEIYSLLKSVEFFLFISMTFTSEL